MVSSSPALAALAGEESSFHQEQAGGRYVVANDRPAEAVNGRTQLTAWRGRDNAGIWMSLGNNNPFRISDNDGTNAAPWVVAYEEDGWMVFHTGTDGHVYYAIVRDQGGVAVYDRWHAIPDILARSNQAVAAVNFGSDDIFLVHRGSQDNRIYGNFFNGYEWSPAQIVGDANTGTVDAPGITFNRVTNRLVVAHRGLDGRIYAASQAVGSGQWTSWRDLGGGGFQGQPAVSSLANGNMLFAALAADHRVYLRETSQNLDTSAPWMRESANVETYYAPYLSQAIAAAAIYLLMTMTQGPAVVWKQATDR